MIQKNTIIFFFIAFVFVLGGGLWYLQKMEQENQQVEQKQDGGANIVQEVHSIDTSNWQTYRNEEYGFEFKYPENINFEKVTGRYAIFVDKNSGLQLGSFVVHYSDPNDFYRVDQEFLMNGGQLDMVYGYEGELAKEGSIGIETQRFKNSKGLDFFIVKRQDYHASENEKYKEVYNFSEGKVEDRAFFICGKELCSFRMYFKKSESQVSISRETFLTILSTMGKL